MRGAFDSREQRLDAARHLDVLRCTEQAVQQRLDGLLNDSARPAGPSSRTAVIAQRHGWYSRRLAAELAALGVDLIGVTEVGAEAAGWAIVEQPDLVVVDETLMMLTGEQTVRMVRQYCPSTRIAARAQGSYRVARLLDAGATSVHVRAVPPEALAAHLLDRRRE